MISSQDATAARDAGRWRWLEKHIIGVEVPDWHWIGPSKRDPLGPLIDAEIANSPKPNG